MATRAFSTKPVRANGYSMVSEQAVVDGVLRAYKEEGSIAQLVRHFYYKVLGYHLVTRHSDSAQDNTSAYKATDKLITRMRHAGILPYGAVVDPGRRSFTYYSSTSLGESISGKVTGYYSPDLWRGQERRLEVWVEKDAMADFVYSAVSPYRVPVRVSKGTTSVTKIYEAAQRYGSGKGWTLLYAGDFDPTGMPIDRHLREGLARHGSYPEIIRIGLLPEDAALMPEAGLRLNIKDGNTPAFIRTYDPDYGPYTFRKPYHGKLLGYELDSLPASILKTRLEETIKSYIDADEWNGAVKTGKQVAKLLTQKLHGVLDGVEADWLATGVPGVEMDVERQRIYLLPEGEAYEDHEVEESDDDDDDDDVTGELATLRAKRDRAQKAYEMEDTDAEESHDLWVRYNYLDQAVDALEGLQRG